MSARDVSIHICECWSRDGLQPLASVVPTGRKLEVLKAVSSAGVAEVDLTGFSRSPQFADSRVLLEKARQEGLFEAVRVLAVNMRSLDDISALDAPGDLLQTCGFPISASESHNAANLRRTVAERQREVEQMVEACRAVSVEPLLCIATAFGCPIEGDVPFERVAALAEWAAGLGVRRLMLGDTTGRAVPASVFDVFTRLAEAHPGIEMIAHFHDTRGTGMANAFAALQAGVRSFDTSLGGSGGEPKGILTDQSGLTGNLCSEDFVVALERSGWNTGIDPAALLDAGRLAEEVTGVESHSRVLLAGL